MTFGEKLFKLRKEKGLSQEALAEKVNTRLVSGKMARAFPRLKSS